MKRLLLLIFAVTLCITPHLAEARTHVEIILGQGGRPTSSGMFALQAKVRRLPGVSVHVWRWRDMELLAKHLRQIRSGDKVALVGYSQGANIIPLIVRRLRRRVDLVVGYDPCRCSRFASLYMGHNVRRVVVYHNNFPDIYGGGMYRAAVPVEVVEIAMPHLLVDWSWRLHNYTLKLIREIQ